MPWRRRRPGRGSGPTRSSAPRCRTRPRRRGSASKARASPAGRPRGAGSPSVQRSNACQRAVRSRCSESTRLNLVAESGGSPTADTKATIAARNQPFALGERDQDHEPERDHGAEHGQPARPVEVAIPGEVAGPRPRRASRSSAPSGRARRRSASGSSSFISLIATCLPSSSWSKNASTSCSYAGQLAGGASAFCLIARSSFSSSVVAWPVS